MEFVKRPVAVFCSSFFLVFLVLVNFDVRPSSTAVAAAIIAPAAATMTSFAFHGKLRVALRYAALVAAGAVLAASFEVFAFIPETEKYDFTADNTYNIRGSVNEVLWSAENETCYSVSVESLDGEKVSFKTAMTATAGLSGADSVTAKCTFSKISGSSEYVNYYKSKGIFLSSDAAFAVKTGEDVSVLSYFVRLREKLCTILSENLDSASSGVARAVLLGDRSALTDRVSGALSRVGIYHLVAISGMHVSFIAFALTAIFKRFRVGKRKISVIVIIAMIFYMFLTGFSPSVTRAGAMCCAAMMIALFGISYDGATVLSFCGAVMVAAEPSFALSPAMQLSFAACVGCFAGAALSDKINVTSKTQKHRFSARVAGYVLKSFAFTSVIVAVSMPVTLLYYGRLSLLSPLSNLVFIPAFSVILYVAALVLILSPVPFLCSAVSFVGGGFIKAVVWLADRESTIHGAAVSLRFPFSAVIAIVTSAALIASALGKKKIRRYAAALAAFCVLIYGAGVALYELTLPSATVCRVGTSYGECVVVKSGGESAMIDIGSGSSQLSASYGRGALDELAVADLDVYVMSKCTSASVEAMKKVVFSERPPRVAIISKNADEGALAEALSFLQEEGVSAELCGGADAKTAVGECVISFSVNLADDANSSAPCFKVQSGKGSFMYLGANYLTYHPGAVGALGGADTVMIGSCGKASDGVPDTSDFYNCRIICFSDEYGKFASLGAEVLNVNSTVVLNID